MIFEDKYEIDLDNLEIDKNDNGNNKVVINDMFLEYEDVFDLIQTIKEQLVINLEK